jgi:WD40 repeat protein
MLVLNHCRPHTHHLRFAPDGRTLAAVDAKTRAVRLYDLATLRPRADLTGGWSRVTDLAFSPDGQRLAVGSLFGTVTLLNLLSHQTRVLHQGDPERVWLPGGHVAFSPDGEWLATSGHFSHYQTAHGGELRLWEGGGQYEGVTMSGGSGYRVTALRFTPDGRTLVAAYLNRTLQFWEAETGRLQFRLWHGHKVHFMDVAADGCTLAAASMNGVVRLWNLDTGHHRCNLRTRGRRVLGLTFSTDGRRLLTVGDDQAAHLWDADTGELCQSYDWQVGAVSAAAFAPDGMRAAVAGAGGIVLWDLDDFFG